MNTPKLMRLLAKFGSILLSYRFLEDTHGMLYDLDYNFSWIFGGGLGSFVAFELMLIVIYIIPSIPLWYYGFKKIKEK